MTLPQQQQGQADTPAPNEQPTKATEQQPRFTDEQLAEFAALDVEQQQELGIANDVMAARARGVQPAVPKDDDEEVPAPAAGVTEPPQKQPEAKQDQTDQGQQKPTGSPPPGLIEERQRRQQAERMLADMQAQMAAQGQILQALMAGQNLGQATAPAEQKPQVDPMAELEAKRTELDRKYDAGEVSWEDWSKQNRSLDREERRLEREQAQPQAAVPRQPTESLMLAEASRAIERANPWLNQLSDQQIAGIRDLAVKELEIVGVDLSGEHGTLALRQHFVAVGKRLFGIQDDPPPTDQKPQTKTQPNQQRAPGISPDQLKAKLALGSTHPPDISNLPRSNGAAPGDLTIDDLASMSFEQIRQLPKATKDRLWDAHGVE